MRILVVNAGSSSLKLSVISASASGRPVVAAEPAGGAGIDLVTETTATLHPADSGPDGAELKAFVEQAGAVDAVGHRVVHGGTAFTAPVVVDAAVRRQLQSLVELAPLHQPASLRAIDAVGALLPQTPGVACFDTAFHATIPPAAATYALPAEWRRRWPLRKFGFHGLSHAYASRRAAELVGRPVEELRTISCHLGSGASVTAIAGGTSVDTTMGFTPLDGLVMATRSGAVDPGLVLWLQVHTGMSAADVGDALEEESGLKGLAGSPDMAEVLAAEHRGDDAAALAVAVYLHRLSGSIAAMAAALRGVDVLVFTGGVGEHAPDIRRRATGPLTFLGMAVDERANLRATPDADVSEHGAAGRTLVITAREDLQIAQDVWRLLDA